MHILTIGRSHPTTVETTLSVSVTVSVISVGTTVWISVVMIFPRKRTLSVAVPVEFVLTTRDSVRVFHVVTAVLLGSIAVSAKT